MSEIELIKVLVVESKKENREQIREILSNIEYIKINNEAGSSQEALDELNDYNLDVVLIDSYVDGDGYKLAERIISDYPDVSVIMLEDNIKEETLRQAISVGAVDVIIKPITPGRLVDAIYHGSEQKKKKQILSRENKTGKRDKKGQVITVFSTKGGTGKTFISTNLAVNLAEKTNENVVLVDLDLDFGDAALSLNLMPHVSIPDIINEIRNLDEEMMNSFLLSHGSGIKVLAASTQPQQADFVSAEHIEKILKVLQDLYAYVVIDMPARFQETVMPAFKLSEMSFLVVTPDVASVRNIKSCMVILQDLGYPKSKIKLLLNKEEPRGEVKVKDVEKTLNHNIYYSIPADYKIAISSLNKGEPLSAIYPRSKLNKSFITITEKIVAGNSKIK